MIYVYMSNIYIYTKFNNTHIAHVVDQNTHHFICLELHKALEINILIYFFIFLLIFIFTQKISKTMYNLCLGKC